MPPLDSTVSAEVKLQAIGAAGSSLAICSLPLPPSHVTVKVDGARSVQVTPLGHWPARVMANPRHMWPWENWPIEPGALDTPPRRGLVLARFDGPAPDRVQVQLEPVASPQMTTGSIPITYTPTPGDEFYHHRDEKLYHYVKREDAITIAGLGRRLVVRLALRVKEELRFWQWTQVVTVWDGPLSKAVVIGGHIYGGPEDRPMTMEESKHPEATPFHAEQMISAKAFIVAYADGSLDMTVHYTNVQGYGVGCAVEGLPVVEVSSPTTLNADGWRIDEGRTEMADDGRTWRWTPMDSTSIWLGRRTDPDGGPMRDEYVAGSETHLVKGVARSSSCLLSLTGAVNAPRRYLAEPAWYLRCGELGVALPCRTAEGFETLTKLSDAAEPVFLRNIHGEGMSRGGVYRYLDQHTERHELSMDGNEAAFMLRGAYLRGSGALYDAALNAARNIGDIAVDHYQFNVHYHADAPAWNVFSQIYLRFGGLVGAYAETGDPWHLENAEAVANRWIAINRLNQPRQNMGRDAEPVEGILMLYDLTGKDHYFQEAQLIAEDVARSLFADGSWRCGFGVGPYWGINALQGSPWNGSHLLAGIAEFLMRACPQTCPGYDAMLESATKLVRRLLHLVRTECAGYHRATGSFLPRRHFLVAYFADDKQLVTEVRQLVRRLEQEFINTGEGFYRTGHHCGGYLDSPAVFLALDDISAPWDTPQRRPTRPVTRPVTTPAGPTLR